MLFSILYYYTEFSSKCVSMLLTGVSFFGTFWNWQSDKHGHRSDWSCRFAEVRTCEDLCDQSSQTTSVTWSACSRVNATNASEDRLSCRTRVYNSLHQTNSSRFKHCPALRREFKKSEVKRGAGWMRVGSPGIKRLQWSVALAASRYVINQHGMTRKKGNTGPGAERFVFREHKRNKRLFTLKSSWALKGKSTRLLVTLRQNEGCPRRGTAEAAVTNVPENDTANVYTHCPVLIQPKPQQGLLGLTWNFVYSDRQTHAASPDESLALVFPGEPQFSRLVWLLLNSA